MFFTPAWLEYSCRQTEVRTSQRQNGCAVFQTMPQNKRLFIEEMRHLQTRKIF